MKHRNRKQSTSKDICEMQCQVFHKGVLYFERHKSNECRLNGKAKRYFGATSPQVAYLFSFLVPIVSFFLQTRVRAVKFRNFLQHLG